MSSESRALGRVTPASASEWLFVLKTAGYTVLRGVALIAAVILLAKIRSDTNILVHGGAVAAGLGLVYFALGSGFRIWGLYIGAFVVFAHLRAYGDEIGTPVQYDYPIVAERILFLGTLPNNWLQDAFYSYKVMGATEFYTMFIYLSYFFTPHILAVVLYMTDRERFKRYAGAFLITIYIGLITCALLPTAPPWLAGQVGDIPHVYQIVSDISGEVAPGAYNQGYNVAGANPVAAMPSLHAGVPFLMAIALWKYSRLRWIGAWYALSMAFSIVYLGEHYFVDALAGWGAASAAWFLSGRFIAWWKGRTPAGAAEPPPDGIPEPARAAPEPAA